MYEPYATKYGSLPNFSFMNSTEEALLKLRSGGQLDVCVANDVDTLKWHEAGVIVPISTDRLANWPDTFDSVRNLDTIRVGGQIHFIPAIIFSVSILYRTDLIDKVDSWSVLWDEKYKGRIALLDNAIDCIVPAAASLGINPFSMTDSEMQKVTEILRKQREVAKFYWSNPTDLEQSLASGEIAVAYGWGESFRRLVDQKVAIGYATPKEGKIMEFTGCLITKGARGDEQRIYDFIDSWISPQSGKFILEQFGMGSVNRKASYLANSDRLRQIGLESFEDDFKSAILYKAVSLDQQQKNTLIFEQVKAGGCNGIQPNAQQGCANRSLIMNRQRRDFLGYRVFPTGRSMARWGEACYLSRAKHRRRC